MHHSAHISHSYPRQRQYLDYIPTRASSHVLRYHNSHNLHSNSLSPISKRPDQPTAHHHITLDTASGHISLSLQLLHPCHYIASVLYLVRITCALPAMSSLCADWRRVAVSLLLLLLSAVCVSGDLYLHHPAGSTNRLNEASRARANDNRVFDSQDNNRGGYPVPSTGRMYYYVGSLLYVEWTAQHACGGNPTDNCQFVLQYSCDNTNTMRDGNTTTTIPDPFTTAGGNTACINGNCDTDVRYGRHESQAYWNITRWTARNAGLFLADQQLAGNSARYTRQNNNGATFGYECAEERDYYPYWRPSPWKDIAVFTNQGARCAAYQSESANVKARYQCVIATLTAAQQQSAAQGNPFIPITMNECVTAGGVWTMVPAFNIPPPLCVVLTNSSRDNHLGNPSGSSGYTYNFNWTVPNDYSESCVLRMRYNISTSDFSLPNVHTTDATDGGFASTSSVQSGVDYTFNHQNTAQTTVGLAVAVLAGFAPNNTQNPELADQSKSYTRGFTYKTNPYVDPFGPLLWQNSSVTPSYGSVVQLKLAINTAQFARTFQDRSFMFAIRQRPAELDNAVIHNVNVRGKRGNIGNQRHALRPTRHTARLLLLMRRPYSLRAVHSASVSQRGVRLHPGPADSDGGRHAALPMERRRHQSDQQRPHQRQSAAGQRPLQRRADGTHCLARERPAEQHHHSRAVGPSAAVPHQQRAGLPLPGTVHHRPAATRTQWHQRLIVSRSFDTSAAPLILVAARCLLIDARMCVLLFPSLCRASFDLGPRQVTRSGTYHYMSTRNNAFSNRSQKGKLVVLPSNSSSAQYESVEWGLQCGSDSGGMPSGTYVDAGQCSGQLVTSQDVFLSSGGSSSYDSEWYQLQPQQLTLQSPLWVTLPFRYLPLNQPQVYWKPNATALNLLRVGGEVQSGSSVTFAASAGGYYVVQNAVNGGEVAGIVLAGALIVAVMGFLYWKVRVQPYGGVESWMRECCRRATGGHSTKDDEQASRQLMDHAAPASTAV